MENSNPTTAGKSADSFQLPPSLDSIQTHRPKFDKRKFFSFAIFKESVKSNSIGTLIVGLLNAVILIIVVSIMSSLNINGTKTAMKSMFDTASEETDLKTGAVGYYANYSDSAQAYFTMDSSLTAVQTQLTAAATNVKSSNTSSMISTVEKAYDSAYALATGTPAQKHETAKATVSSSMNSLLGFTSYTEEEKAEAKVLVPLYLDQYYLYKTDSTNTTVNTYEKRMVEVLPGIAITKMEESYSLSKDNASQIQTLFHDSLYSILVDGQDADTVGAQAAIRILPLAVDDSEKSMVTTMASSLQSAYSADPASYSKNTDHYRSLAISTSVTGVVVDTFSDIAYYNYLPDFDVAYQTSDLGWPITYETTGNVDSQGNPIKKEVEIKYYDPTLFIPLTSGMGTKANMLQKMRKKALTGVEYTEAEVTKAKEDSQEILTKIQDKLTSFMSVLVTSPSTYYDGSAVKDEAIQSKATEDIVSEVESKFLEQYNSDHGTNLTAISEITAEDYSMSGATIEETLYSYASGGIASYKTLYAKQVELGRTTKEATMVALVKSATGIIDQLPSSVQDSLLSMANNNTYGFFIGIVTFGMACVLLPLVYTIILANSLVAEKVETGSLAFTLSTPTKRSTFVNTEVVFLIATELFLSFLLFIGALIARYIGIQIGGKDLIKSFSVADLSMYSFGQFMVMLAISGICFLSSCFFNKTRYAIAVGGGINIFFYICSIMGLFGTEAMPSLVRIPSMNFFNYMTILSLNDGFAVMNHYPVYWYKLLSLLGIAILTYSLGMFAFNKKDLPL
jgi:ABC-2 type transport system permease protein